jgi:hypothetical protein
MRRLACLLIVLLAAPVACIASDAVADVPVAQVTGACKATVAQAPVAEAAVPTDAPARSADAAPARPASGATGGSVRTPSPRWSRLLPGMFR